jgi:quercetin dioxygenase-like cupin family protein
MGVALGATALAASESMPGHAFHTPDAMSWGAGPPSLPKGVQATVLYGDPGKEGMFVLRLKMPAGYKVPPHTHPTAELVTVISGELHLGTGPSGTAENATAMPPGSFASLDAGMVHYAIAKNETVVQVSAMGPFGVTYVDPKDDPRNAATN